jgi:hypothetical protein
MQENILQTLIYADLFDYPLTVEEIYQRLHHKKTTIDQVETGLKKLLNQGKLKKTGQLYFLPEKKKNVRLRKKTNKISQQKAKKAKQLAQLLKIIPTIQLVGLTGSVAAGNAEEGDDLDFLIITSAGWLWLTRFLVTGLFTIFGLRRRPGDEEYKNKVCLNLFLDNGHLNAFAQKQNLFLAYELILMQPLWEKKQTYKKLLATNLWVKKYLPNAVNWEEIKGVKLEGVEVNKFVQNINFILFKLQKLWMKKRITNEKVELNLIAFHPQDLSKTVMKKYKKELKEKFGT